VPFIRNVTFMTPDPEGLAEFWAGALGFLEKRVHPDEILLSRTGQTFPRLTFQRVRGPARSGANRVHLDITAESDRMAEVLRLAHLGAREQRSHTVDGFSWTVMTDPDGNEFCVTDP
jgi:catechol 2,3-dioxygenase-like lactoylglutathione lyase family enzyme